MLLHHICLLTAILFTSSTLAYAKSTSVSDITLKYLEKERQKNETIDKAYRAALKIYKISQKILKQDEAAQIAWFIETQLSQKNTNNKVLFKAHDTHLAFPIEYDPESNLTFIHLASHSDGYIGKGQFKIATKSILYNSENPEIVANCEAESGLKKEVAATKALSGKPGIFQVYAITQNELGHKKVKTSIISKLYNKGSLENFLKSHGSTLTLQEKMNIALNLLQGLGTIHDAGFIHRDLGTRNYLVNTSQDPNTGERIIDAVISDFGRSVPLEDAPGTVSQGNSSYTPPEGMEIERLKSTDYFAIDIYALGCALFRLHYNKQQVPHVPAKQAIKDGKNIGKLKKRLIKKLQALSEKKLNHLKRKSNSQQAAFEKLILQMVHPDPKHRGTTQDLIVQLKKIIHKKTA